MGSNVLHTRATTLTSRRALRLRFWVVLLMLGLGAAVLWMRNADKSVSDAKPQLSAFDERTPVQTAGTPPTMAPVAPLTYAKAQASRQRAFIAAESAAASATAAAQAAAPSESY